MNYLLRVSAGLSLVYIFYYVVLSRLTFYQWNRAYLLSQGLLCFLLPLVDISSIFVSKELPGQYLMNRLPVIGVAVESNTSPDNISLILAGAAFLGMIAFGIRVLIQYISLNRVRKTAELWHTEDAVRFYITDRNISPFSFGKGIYVNPKNHTDAELENIILHEMVHVKQEHTVDLIAGEILCVLNWYNPFAWLLRSAIRQNLEFIADSRVLSQGKDRKTYQYFLLKVVGSGAFTVGNHFSISNLKKRIVMMNKIKTARLHLSRFLFAIPLLVFILVSFRSQWRTESSTSMDLTQDTIPVKKSNPVRESRPKSMRNSKAESKSRSLSESSADASPSPNVKPGPDAGPVPNASPSPIVNINVNPNLKPSANSNSPGKMLIVVDGVKKPRGFDFNTIPDSTIVSINVLKGAAAVDKYGDEGKDGVLEIITDSGKGRAPVTRLEDPAALRRVNESMRDAQVAMLDKQSSLQREANELARIQGVDRSPDRNRVDEAMRLAIENQRTLALENSERLKRQVMDIKENREKLETKLRNENGRVNNMSRAQQKKIREETEFQIKKHMEAVMDLNQTKREGELRRAKQSAEDFRKRKSQP